MYLINKLPELLSLIGSVIICFLAIKHNYDLKEFSQKLILVITALFGFGYILRDITVKFLLNVLKQSERKAKMIRKYENEQSNNMSEKSFLSISNEEDDDDEDEDEDEDEEFEPYTPDKT